jgi:hypothetical protein
MNTKQHNGNQQRQAIIWGRFSDDKQSDGDSKPRQERLNRALAKREVIKVLAEYFDPATSVKVGATPLFKKVVSELPAGVGIICENLDRINRGHPWRAKAYIADILEAGHFIITSQDGREYNTDTIEDLDTMVLGDMAANVARYENNKRIKRVNEAIGNAIDLARKGIPAPLGSWLPPHVRYNFETGKYDIDKPIKAVYQRLFTEYLSGKGSRTICQGLNADGTPTLRKKTGAWTESTILKLLRNERAIGILTINGERIVAGYEKAVTEDLFYQVQSMLEKNTNRHGNRTAEIQNVFRGVCHCSVCGGSMKVFKGRWLGCLGFRNKKLDPTGKPCSIKNMIPFPEVEREFISWFVPTAKDALLGKDDSQSRIDALQAKKDALKAKIEQTIALLDAGLALPEVQSRLTKLEAERRETEANLSEAKAEQSSKAVMPDTMNQLEAIMREANLGNQDTRRKIANIVPSLVKSVVINISDKLYPSFRVILTNDRVIEYTMTLMSHYGKHPYKPA